MRKEGRESRNMFGLWFKYGKRNKTGSFRKQQESVEITGTKKKRKKSKTLHLVLLSGQ